MTKLQAGFRTHPKMNQADKQTLVRTLGLTLGPFVLYTIWLLPTECGVRVKPPFDTLTWVFLAASILFGVCFLWRLALPAAVKLWSTLLYIPAVGCALLYYALLVAGVVFGNWL